MERFKNVVVIAVGAGIGLEIARLFGSEGENILIFVDLNFFRF